MALRILLFLTLFSLLSAAGLSESPNVNNGTDSGSPPIAKILGFFVAVFCSVGAILVFFCRIKVEPSSHVTVACSTVDGESRGIGTMRSSGPRELQIVKDDCLVFSVQVLKNATDNFNEKNILYSGKFGSVYKGVLHDGTKIAVKRMIREMMWGEDLESEIFIHTKVRHINLVKLLGYCLNGSDKLLVFELMTQGNLERFLFHWKEEGLKPLEWMKRLGIALDVARGVEYLHNFAGQSFIHKAVASSKILLGDDMRAKVSDFRHASPDVEKFMYTRKIVGTFGYVDPDFAATGRVSTKMDVYSFGVVLMELITGRKAFDTSLPKEKWHLATLFHRGTDEFLKLIDPYFDLREQETFWSIMTVAALALHCSSEEPKQRPDMSHVVCVLSYLAGVWDPTKPLVINRGITLDQMMKKRKAIEAMTALRDWNLV